MAKQVVNTDRIKLSTDRLRSINNNINKEFDNLKKNSQKLNNNWKGKAGEVANTKLQQLLNYNTARSNVLQNYINILAQQVNPGYENAENVNTKLAEKFK